MRYFRLVVLALVTLTLGCQPSGCGRPVTPPDSSVLPPVTDDLGRVVRLSKPPERIISLSPAATEILFAIGAGPKVVAGTEYDTYPEDAKKLPRIGGFTPQSINIEAILSHKPDLVVAAPQKDVIAALEKFGIPVVALEPKEVNDVWKNIELLGNLTDCGTKAKELNAGLRKRWSATTASKTPRPRVFVLVDEPNFTCGSGTFLDEIVTTAGGTNLFGDTNGWSKVSDEQVLARNPEVILCFNHAGLAGADLPERLKKRPGWDKLKAVQNGKVYSVEADLLTRPGPRLVDGLEAVEKLLHK